MSLLLCWNRNRHFRRLDARGGAGVCTKINYARVRGEVARVGKKYEEKVGNRLTEIAEWTRQGATIKEIAGLLGVAYSTLRKYLDEGEAGNERYAPLWRTYEQAGREPDGAVEAALFKRACGYQYTEETEEERMDRDGNVVVLHKKVVRDVPPDTKAAMFWLANNRRERWKYKPEESGEREDTDGGVVIMPPVMEATE